ncbi:MAG: ABC transporter permease, partial [Microcystaceae cyanobacterium]
MDWWKKLQHNLLARIGAITLIIFYVSVIGADFIAPYNPYLSQVDGSLLPPTTIHFRNPEGQWIGPTVYPVTQSPTDLKTGDRALKTDYQRPSSVGFFVQGDPYQLFQIKLPLPPHFKEVEIFSGFTLNRHLFGTTGEAKINLLGTDEQGRDQFSRLLFGGRISLFIGLVGIAISFPLGMIIGGISGYFGGWLDAILMRFVEVL